MKLDCISYLAKRRIIPSDELMIIEEQTRNRLRQIKYHADAASGRIRISEQRLASEINSYLNKLSEQYSQVSALVGASGDDIRDFLDERWQKLSSLQLSNFVCFKSRVAFDYLLSNLRHNFLRFRLESAIDSAFDSRKGADAIMCKTAIADELASYCEIWLTISPKRSFFADLDAMFKEHLPDRSADLSGNERSVSAILAGVAISHFSSLLDDCREQWRGPTQIRITNLALEVVQKLGLGNDTTLRDAIHSCLGRAFDDSAGWLTVNDRVLDAEFGLREFFKFEATNFSTAKTRRQPLVIECFRYNSAQGKRFRTRQDIAMASQLRDAMIAVIHNLLENAYRHCGLSVASTAIEVQIVDLGAEVLIEVRNNFSRDKAREMREAVRTVNDLAKGNAIVDSSTPRQSGGSGVRRIRFELDSVVAGRYSISASDAELHMGKFLVAVQIPKV